MQRHPFILLELMISVSIMAIVLQAASEWILPRPTSEQKKIADGKRDCSWKALASL